MDPVSSMLISGLSSLGPWGPLVGFGAAILLNFVRNRMNASAPAQPAAPAEPPATPTPSNTPVIDAAVNWFRTHLLAVAQSNAPAVQHPGADLQPQHAANVLQQLLSGLLPAAPATSGASVTK